MCFYPSSVNNVLLVLTIDSRYGIWIHGCVEGFSRRIVWLEAHNNKRARTVRKIFERARQRFNAHPERVRCDKGRENVGIMFLMYLYNQNRISKPVLAGRSIHNTRIERLWWDVHRVVGSRFKNIFESLKYSGELDLDDPLDLWVLHTIFLPIINRSLRTFQTTWDFHRSASAQEKSPHRLYLEGLALQSVDGRFTEPVGNDYAIDPNEERPVELAAHEVDEGEEVEHIWEAGTMNDIEQLEASADEAASLRQEIQVPLWVRPHEGFGRIDDLIFQYTPLAATDGDDRVGISCYRLLRNAIRAEFVRLE